MILEAQHHFSPVYRAEGYGWYFSFIGDKYNNKEDLGFHFHFHAHMKLQYKKCEENKRKFACADEKVWSTHHVLCCVSSYSLSGYTVNLSAFHCNKMSVTKSSALLEYIKKGENKTNILQIFLAAKMHSIQLIIHFDKRFIYICKIFLFDEHMYMIAINLTWTKINSLSLAPSLSDCMCWLYM